MERLLRIRGHLIDGYRLHNRRGWAMRGTFVEPCRRKPRARELGPAPASSRVSCNVRSWPRTERRLPGPEWLEAAVPQLCSALSSPKRYLRPIPSLLGYQTQPRWEMEALIRMYIGTIPSKHHAETSRECPKGSSRERH